MVVCKTYLRLNHVSDFDHFSDDDPVAEEVPTSPDLEAVSSAELTELRAQLKFEKERAERYLPMMRGLNDALAAQKEQIDDLKKRIAMLETAR